MPNTNQQPICKIDPYGSKRWYLNNQLHRVDGPAIEHTDGDKHWYLNDIEYKPPRTKYPLQP